MLIKKDAMQSGFCAGAGMQLTKYGTTHALLLCVCSNIWQHSLVRGGGGCSVAIKTAPYLRFTSSISCERNSDKRNTKQFQFLPLHWYHRTTPPKTVGDMAIPMQDSQQVGRGGSYKLTKAIQCE
jgi:hypothetical protein